MAGTSRGSGRQQGQVSRLTALALTGALLLPAGPPQHSTGPDKLPTNARAASLSRSDSLRLAPYNLSGEGVMVGAWDAGTAQVSHPEFGGRIIVPDGGAVFSHATHVAGTIMAAGKQTAARGMAPAATLLSHDFYGNVLQEQRDAWSQYGMVLANHSWDYAEGWLYDRYDDGLWVWYGDPADSEESDFGAYRSLTRDWDQLVVDTGLIIVKSAGNERNDSGAGNAPHHHYGEPSTQYTDWHQADGANGGYDTIGPMGTAKNVITVGAVDGNSAMTAFSSWGPTDDGRVKPDIVAAGIGLYSTTDNSGYATLSGTSMAAAVASGSLALLVERYQSQYGAPPAPSLVRALLANTARDLGNSGPDYVYGWGLLDTLSALATLDASGLDNWPLQNGQLSTGQTRLYDLDVPAGLGKLKVSLAWTDPPAYPGALATLVNDLDLTLLDPQGRVHYPFSLAGRADPAAPATASGPNRVDTVEQVLVRDPEPGLWQVRVSAATISGSQAYDLVSNVYLGADGPRTTDSVVAAAAQPLPSGAGGSDSAGGGGGGGSTGLLSLLGLWLLRRRQRPHG